MLKSFILSKTNSNEDSLEENIAAGSNNNENNQSDSEILPLQQRLIAQTTNPHVTKIRETSCKRRIKGIMEGKKVGKVDSGEAKAQRKCLLYDVLGHYQKRCLNTKNRIE